MALKIVYNICCGIDVHKNFVVACIASTDSNGVTTYESTGFRPTREILKICYCGFWIIAARMSVWNPPVNTGSLSTTFWKTTVRLSLHIPNMLRLSVERKLTRKMPNGLLTCLSMILLPEALCRPLTSASFVTL